MLDDAQLWDLLEGVCRKQISELTEFRVSYERLTILHEKGLFASGDVGDDLEDFRRKTDDLQELHQEDLNTLKEASRNLINWYAVASLSKREMQTDCR